MRKEGMMRWNRSENSYVDPPTGDMPPRGRIVVAPIEPSNWGR